MAFLKRLFNFYINASLHVSLAVCALVGVTAFTYTLEIPTAFWGFVFFGTVTGYNFVKYAEIAGLRHRSLAESLKAIQLFSVLCFGLLLFFALQLSMNTLLATGGFAMLTVFYAVPLFQHKNLRTFFGLKIFIVAMVWAGVTVIVPIIASEGILNTDVWVNFCQRFLMVIALTIPFEVRDLRFDVVALGTLPQQMGMWRSKIFGTVLLTMGLILEFFKTELNPAHFQSTVFAFVLIGLALFYSEKNQPKYYASFWVESIPMFWFAALYLLIHFRL